MKKLIFLFILLNLFLGSVLCLYNTGFIGINVSAILYKILSPFFEIDSIELSIWCGISLILIFFILKFISLPIIYKLQRPKPIYNLLNSIINNKKIFIPSMIIFDIVFNLSQIPFIEIFSDYDFLLILLYSLLTILLLGITPIYTFFLLWHNRTTYKKNKTSENNLILPPKTILTKKSNNQIKNVIAKFLFYILNLFLLSLSSLFLLLYIVLINKPENQPFLLTNGTFYFLYLSFPFFRIIIFPIFYSICEFLNIKFVFFEKFKNSNFAKKVILISFMIEIILYLIFTTIVSIEHLSIFYLLFGSVLLYIIAFGGVSLSYLSMFIWLQLRKNIN